MELLKLHNDSPEGNESILQLNIMMLKNEIAEYERLWRKAFENCDIHEAELYQESIDELEEQLDEIENL